MDRTLERDERDEPFLKVGSTLGPRQPGYNVDPIDREAGLRQLRAFGYNDEHTVMVIDYCLWRWGHGEEAAAEKAAIDKSFHGIDYTSWRAVLATAIASGTEKLEQQLKHATS